MWEKRGEKKIIIKLTSLAPPGLCKGRSSKHFSDFDGNALALHGFYLTEQFRFLIKFTKCLALFHNELLNNTLLMENASTYIGRIHSSV